MRSGRLLFVIPLLLLLGCNEVPECLETSSGVVVDCSAGKVPVCGTDPDLLYNPNTGALLPVPPASVANGSCDGIDGLCRPRPVCGAAGETPTCANGEGPVCRLGRVTEVRNDPPPPPPPTDSGPTDEDAGADEDGGASDDAGAGEDAGSIDGGSADAGGASDAGMLADAATDAGCRPGGGPGGRDC